MKIRKQNELLAKLEIETRKAMRSMENKYLKELLQLWKSIKSDMQTDIMRIYRAHFGSQPWDIISAGRKQTLAQIATHISMRLAGFHGASLSLIHKALREIRREETLRAAWMLDQITPPSYKPKTPARALETNRPGDYRAGWQDALDSWITSYRDTLMTNLRLEALNEGDMNDAIDEIDASRVGGSDMASKLQSLFTTQAIQEEADARAEFADVNDEAVAKEVWLTLEDDRVCPLCDDNDGRSIEEIGHDPPEHFNCRCYQSVVPSDWADMLANGTPEEQDAALMYEDQGLVPSSMAVLDGNGDLTGMISVSFNSWKKNQAQFVSGGI